MCYNKCKLNQIVQRYWNDYQQKKKDSQISKYIVDPSIPVIWFGDMNAYFNSQIRTLTIGINPSRSEFGGPYIFDIALRFPAAKNIHNSYKPNILAKACNDYFKNPSVYRWFNFYDNKCMGFVSGCVGGYSVSYYSTQQSQNVALHIDMETAIATNPTWKNLNAMTKSRIRNRNLFYKLFDFLNPHTVFISINRDLFYDLCVRTNYNITNPLCVSSSGKMECYLCDGKLIFWGRSNGQPFAPIRDAEKQQFFQDVFKHVTFDAKQGRWV